MGPPAELTPMLFLLVPTMVSSQSVLWPDCESLPPDEGNGTCAAPACPNCGFVECLPELEEYDCPDGYVFTEGVAYGGCCPACVKYRTFDPDLIEYETCGGGPQFQMVESQAYRLPCVTDPGGEDVFATDEVLYPLEGAAVDTFAPLVSLYRCLDKIECSTATNKCDPEKEDEGSFLSDVDYYNCVAYQYYFYSFYDVDCSDALALTDGRLLWNVTCDGLGHYARTQRKENPQVTLEKKDMCSSPDGATIFGYTTEEEERLGCRCSRKHWELTQDLQTEQNPEPAGALFMEGRTDVSLHCREEGDFEPLQCDQDRCWCVDGPTGKPTSTAVTGQFYQLLPCYEDETVTGSQYLRQCESRALARSRIRQLLSYHGQEWPVNEYEDIPCDADGSFGYYRCVESEEICFCSDKYGYQIGQYYADLTYAGQMDCRCARDSADDLTTLACDSSTGAYEEVQTTSAAIFCVDTDGFPYTAFYSDKQCRVPACDEDAIGEYCNQDNFDCVDCTVDQGSCDLSFATGG